MRCVVSAKRALYKPRGARRAVSALTLVPRGRALSCGQVVLDNLLAARHLPELVLAFFYMSEESRATATRMHANFLAMYSLSDERLCPLLRLDLAGEGDPFSSDQ